MIIREVEKPNIRDLIGLSGSHSGEKQKILEKNVLDGVEIVGSGKGAIAIILKYLRKKNIIVNKLDEVMVADWIGYWVYNQVQSFAFPVKKFSDRTKVILVYHQYGFPQDMDKILEFAHDKNLIVIEDCAHALASDYHGQPLGSFGDFTLYSFSKWFFCFALGGVKSKYNDFSVYVEKTLEETPRGVTFIKDFSKFLSEKSTFSNSNFFKRYASLFLGMSYSLYGEALRPSSLAKRLLNLKIDREINIRQKRYQYFFDNADSLGICDDLEKEGITPYVIPIFCPKNKNRKLVELLSNKGIVTGVYNFDKNRNLLSPNFVECVWLPCHGGISDEMFSDIVDLVLGAIKT